MKITPITINFLNKTITDLNIRTSFGTEDVTCRLSYSLLTANKEIIKSGFIDLTEQEYADWGYENSYIEDIVLNNLGLTRLAI